MFLTSTMHPSIFWMDVSCNAIFSFEIFLRFLFSPNKMKFAKNILNCVEILSVISVWIYLFIEENPSILVNYYSFLILEIVSPLCILRVARFFRLTKNSKGMQLLILSVKGSTRLLMLLAISLLQGVIMFASLVYVTEFETSSTFPDFFISMWWAVITMTTVGFGDHYPISHAGHLVGASCAIFGLLLLALPIAIISTTFNNYYAICKDMERYKNVCNEKCRRKRMGERTSCSTIDTYM